ncbi:ethanolamine kinase 1 [Diplogelasinospora grovesii]|uniref:ethanolamine kinase n=1 Tax=Diplogelasinospora grovesii TaxID=303347 RepID=A0AAN6S0W6_9PEZI|nr:ethanolamine kinase 1 [Diplogelasinospora grovesii]
MAMNGQKGSNLQNGQVNGEGDHKIRYIPLPYSSSDSEASALRLVLAIRPEWEDDARSNLVKFVRFTDGITNTLLKAVNKKPGLSQEQIDKEAILLRAYGNGTEMIIDRQRETQNHELLMKHGLAPELLARFENGMMYRFIQGVVCHPEDLRKPEIYKAVARRLAQWHAVMPCIPGPTGHGRTGRIRSTSKSQIPTVTYPDDIYQRCIDGAAPGLPSPNVFTVMQKWIYALPTETEEQIRRQLELQAEQTRIVSEFSERPCGFQGLVFAHCDLLSGNVIVLPNQKSQPAVNGEAVNGDNKAKPLATTEAPEVAFIDYEYATPSPAAFDIANHFAEWGGFDCDYSVLPTKAQRRAFIAEYVHAYFGFLREKSGPEATKKVDEAKEVEKLCREVNHFRGLPGFYWGIWALIQATISEIDFDYASYAETRLGEYWAWRDECDGKRAKRGEEMPLRETRWNTEE